MYFNTEIFTSKLQHNNIHVLPSSVQVLFIYKPEILNRVRDILFFARSRMIELASICIEHCVCDSFHKKYTIFRLNLVYFFLIPDGVVHCIVAGSW